MRIVSRVGGGLSILSVNEYEYIDVNDDYTPDPCFEILKNFYRDAIKFSYESVVRFRASTHDRITFRSIRWYFGELEGL